MKPLILSTLALLALFTQNVRAEIQYETKVSTGGTARALMQALIASGYKVSNPGVEKDGMWFHHPVIVKAGAIDCHYNDRSIPEGFQFWTSCSTPDGKTDENLENKEGPSNPYSLASELMNSGAYMAGDMGHNYTMVLKVTCVLTHKNKNFRQSQVRCELVTRKND